MIDKYKKQKLNKRQKDFIKDFRDLLKKYDASISWTCDEISDTYGLVDDHLNIWVNGYGDIDLPYNGIDIEDLDYLLNDGDDDNE